MSEESQHPQDPTQEPDQAAEQPDAPAPEEAEPTPKPSAQQTPPPTAPMLPINPVLNGPTPKDYKDVAWEMSNSGGLTFLKEGEEGCIKEPGPPVKYNIDQYIKKALNATVYMPRLDKNGNLVGYDKLCFTNGEIDHEKSFIAPPEEQSSITNNLLDEIINTKREMAASQAYMAAPDVPKPAPAPTAAPRAEPFSAPPQPSAPVPVPTIDPFAPSAANVATGPAVVPPATRSPGLAADVQAAAQQAPVTIATTAPAQPAPPPQPVVEQPQPIVAPPAPTVTQVVEPIAPAAPPPTQPVVEQPQPIVAQVISAPPEAVTTAPAVTDIAPTTQEQTPVAPSQNTEEPSPIVTAAGPQDVPRAPTWPPDHPAHTLRHTLSEGAAAATAKEGPATKGMSAAVAEKKATAEGKTV